MATEPAGKAVMSDGDDEKWLRPAEGRYANYFAMGFNSEEVLLDFGQVYDTEAVFHTRIVTSPLYATQFSALLTQTLSEYADSYGPGRLGGVEPEAPPDLSSVP